MIACVVDFPVTANCLVSKWGRTSGSTLTRVKPSIILTSCELSEIGRISSSSRTGLVFGRGRTTALFKRGGSYPSSSHMLYSSARTGANSCANSLKMTLGIASGPGDFRVLHALRDLKASRTETNRLDGIC